LNSCSLWKAGGLSWSWDVFLFWSKLHVLIKKKKLKCFFSTDSFFICNLKNLDQYPVSVRSLDPDPDLKNVDPGSANVDPDEMIQNLVINEYP